MDKKIKCIDCHWSSTDPGFCICTRSYKIRDPEKLHYCRNFYEKKSGGSSKDTTDILGFMNKIMNKIVEESENKR